jgi:PD-(D/E)XK nuclease superfamily
MATVEIVSKPPVIPSKWDIIPIHGSDVAAFKRCRRYWNWSSPARSNLRRRIDVHGVSDAWFRLWFGSGIHYALEMYYDPILSRDPVESWLTWYQYQLDGGVITEHWIERTPDVSPQKLAPNEYAEGFEDYGGSLWRVRGLRELVPAWEVVEEQFTFHRELGVGMMTFYREWAPQNDDFVCVAAESTYSIPLGFSALDTREDSPNYGKSLEVHARGKRDAVIYYPEMDKFGIIDHKTASVIGEDYFKKTEKDEQCSNYLWATIKESQTNALPWSGHMVDRILYTALRKNYPKPPLFTEKTNVPSLDRTLQSTTPEMFTAAIVGNPRLEDWFRTNIKAQSFYEYLCEKGDDEWIMRLPVTRNVHEIKATGEHLHMIAEEMLDPKLRVYPSPNGEWMCLNCQFRAPCIAADDGSDWQGMLADGYEVNRDR